MKLKYYLRGVGIGIIFATLVMTVSSIMHKYNISDEYIIKEARKLGMVMKNELDGDNGLFGSDETEVSEDTEASQVTENTEDAQNTEENLPSEDTQESESDSQETPSESEEPSESEQPSESEEPEYVTIVVESGDYARQVAEKLEAAGLVEDSEDFRKYMGRNGYGQKLHAGSYQIPIGADYEEICKILITR